MQTRQARYTRCPFSKCFLSYSKMEGLSFLHRVRKQKVSEDNTVALLSYVSWGGYNGQRYLSSSHRAPIFLDASLIGGQDSLLKIISISLIY